MVFNFHREQQQVRTEFERFIQNINDSPLGAHRRVDLELSLNVYALLKYLVHDIPTPVDMDWSCVRNPANTWRVLPGKCMPQCIQ